MTQWLGIIQQPLMEIAQVSIVLRSTGDDKGGMVSAPKMDEVVYVYNFFLEKGSEADFASDCIRTAQKDLGKLR
jgi:hypothetical protein